MQHRILMSEISKLNQSLIIKKIDTETINLQITNNSMLMSIVGEFNQNLKELEKITNTNIFFRGNSHYLQRTRAKSERFFRGDKIFSK